MSKKRVVYFDALKLRKVTCLQYQIQWEVHASLVYRFTAGAQKEGGCRSADAIAVPLQFLLSIIGGRDRKTVRQQSVNNCRT